METVEKTDPSGMSDSGIEGCLYVDELMEGRTLVVRELGEPDVGGRRVRGTM